MSPKAGRSMFAGRQGFTLLELLLAVAMVTVLAGIGAPVAIRAQTRNDLDAAVTVWVSTLRRSEVRAAAVDGDSQWGGHIQNGSITLFKGVSYAARDTNFDEVFTLPITISIGGTNEVVMSKLSGYPAAVGTTTLSAGADSAAVTINSRGMVQW